MPKFFSIMNHNLSKRQKEEIVKSLGVKSILELPEKLKKIWLNLSPVGALDVDNLSQIVNWLKENTKYDDYVLVQGEFGATFYIVDFCFKHGLMPLYATSKREYDEIILKNDNVKRTHIFNHVQFRRYERYEGK